MVLIEVFGLRGTYTLAAAGNVAIAMIAIGLGMSVPSSRPLQGAPALESGTASAQGSGWARVVLFITGFSSVGMEVCWARDFTFVLLTTIYAFALILATYLIATYVGSSIYRTSDLAKSEAFGPRRRGVAFSPIVAARRPWGPTNGSLGSPDIAEHRAAVRSSRLSDAGVG